MYSGPSSRKTVGTSLSRVEINLPSSGATTSSSRTAPGVPEGGHMGAIHRKKTTSTSMSTTTTTKGKQTKQSTTTAGSGGTELDSIEAQLQQLRQRMVLPTAAPNNVPVASAPYPRASAPSKAVVASSPTSHFPSSPASSGDTVAGGGGGLSSFLLQGTFQAPLGLTGERNPTTGTPASGGSNHSVSGPPEDQQMLAYLRDASKEFQESTAPIDEFVYNEEEEVKATHKSLPVYNDPFVFLSSDPTGTGSRFGEKDTAGSSEGVREGVAVTKTRAGGELMVIGDLNPTPPDGTDGASSVTTTPMGMGRGDRGESPMTSTPTKPIAASPGNTPQARKKQQFRYASGFNADSLYTLPPELVSGSGPLPRNRTGTGTANASGTGNSTGQSPTASLGSAGYERTGLCGCGTGQKSSATMHATPTIDAPRPASSVQHVKYRPLCETVVVQECGICFCPHCRHAVVVVPTDEKLKEGANDETEGGKGGGGGGKRCDRCGSSIPLAMVRSVLQSTGSGSETAHVSMSVAETSTQDEYPVRQQHSQSANSHISTESTSVVAAAATNQSPAAAAPSQSEAARMVAELEEAERQAFQDAVREWREANKKESPEGSKASRSPTTTGTAAVTPGVDDKKSKFVKPVPTPYFFHLWQELQLAAGSS